MRGQRCVGCSQDLGTQAGVLGGGDGAATTGWLLWRQVTSGAVQTYPALDTPQADLEDAHRVGPGHASTESFQDAHA